jgi:tetratricopeptide (TPR) repeat protein
MLIAFLWPPNVYSQTQAPSPAETYAKLVERYRLGSTSNAARELSRMDAEALTEAYAAFTDSAPVDSQLQAAVLLHTETAFRLDWEAPQHVQMAEGLIALIKDESVERGFQRQWFLAVGYYFHLLNRYQEAFNLFARAIGEFPEDVKLLLAVGAAHEAAGWLGGTSGHYKEAEKYLRKALSHSPESVEAHVRLAHVLRHRNEAKESLRLLEWTLAHSNEPSAELIAHLVRGDIKRSQNDLEGASQSYRSAIETDPHCQVAATALSNTLQELGEYDESREVMGRYFVGLEASGKSTDGWWRYISGGRERLESVLSSMRGQL